MTWKKSLTTLSPSNDVVKLFFFVVIFGQENDMTYFVAASIIKKMFLQLRHPVTML
jgi:hypothetical protein